MTILSSTNQSNGEQQGTFYMQANPVCEQLDHIKPISMGGHQTSSSNLQTLCNSCHAKKAH